MCADRCGFRAEVVGAERQLWRFQPPQLVGVASPRMMRVHDQMAQLPTVVAAAKYRAEDQR